MKNNKPIIGLSTGYQNGRVINRVMLNHNYMEAIRKLGGIPLMIPAEATDEEREVLLDFCDGVILTGGADIHPSAYGEPVLNDTVKTVPHRDKTDMQLCKQVLRRQMPLLGICRGAQVINVCFGGTLYQDIPAQLETTVQHKMEPDDRTSRHSCIVTPGSPLYETVQADCIDVNSHHHQAIKDVAPGFAVMGRCEDGIIEAIWKPDEKFLWALQWHPEKIFDLDAISCRIFEAFLAACR